MINRRAFLKAGVALLGATSMGCRIAPRSARSDGPAIQTVRGPVRTAELGRTLMHEHVLLRTPGIRENWPHLWDGAECARSARNAFRKLEASGVGTLVDLTTADLGRDADFLRAVQDETSVHIVVATGIYFSDWSLWAVPYWMGRGPDELARAFVHEIRSGVQGTEIKAGVIKLATHAAGVDSFNEACLRAGARAHRETGVPIVTHAIPEEMGKEQQRVFRAEGVDLGRVVIGHQGSSSNLDLFQELMDAGSTIAVDNFGLHYSGFQEPPARDPTSRPAVVAELCSRGYADRIVLSQDANGCADWGFRATHFPPEKNPGWSYTYIVSTVLPMLRERGVTEAQIDQMLVGNPRRLFEAQAPY